MAPAPLRPLGLTLLRSPSWRLGLVATLLAVVVAVTAHAALPDPDNGAGLFVCALLPLLCLTLGVGPLWAVATLVLILAVAIWGPGSLTGAFHNVPAELAIFAIASALVVLVCAVLRSALLHLETTELDRAEARRALRSAEDRFRTLADSVPLLMWVTHADGAPDFINGTYADFLADTYEQAVASNWRDVLHPDDAARVLREQEAGEAAKAQFVIEGRYRRRDGDYRTMRTIVQPRWGIEGEFTGYVGVGFDVTDARRAQDDLKGINDLLAIRVQEALSERDQAEAALHRAQKMEAVGQLTGGVAHDFNNLLTVVIGALDLIQRHPDDVRRRERMLDAALGAARRGERLTQQLLAFSRRHAVKAEPALVDTLLAEAEPLLRHAVGEAVTFSVDAAAPDAVVKLDPGQFEAAIMNLTVNARDATPNGGTIRIETKIVRLEGREIEALEAGDYLRVAVHDTGEGMDAATLPRVFEPFFTTKTGGRGTGLGLSQVYGFARQSGGAATVTSKLGEGASVFLYLPLFQGDAEGLTLPATSARPDPSAALRVLLVEDDAQVAELVGAMLVDLGHHPIHAQNAEAALVIVRSLERVDLMLTDLIMPGEKTGLDLAREATGVRPHLPIILSSGYTGDVLTPAESAPWPLLRKPYGADQLALMITQVIAAPAHAEA